MSLQAYVEMMRPAVERELERIVGANLRADFPEVIHMVRYHMGWEGEGAGLDAQGKRIRPLLVLLCAQAAGGDWQQALPAAAAVELLHNFSLVHDDIQDQSPLRRSRPTVWVKWGAAQAINTGDVIFTLSFLALQDLAQHYEPGVVVEASRLMQKTCLRLTEGQYLDMSYETKTELPVEAYWPMVGGKTSALLSCCAQLGALAGGAQPEQQDAFRDYGYFLGLAFQVLDDWLGIWGDVELTGKSVESDLVTGKKTLPVLYALSKDGLFARRWWQGPVKPEEAPALAELLKEEGAYDFTLQTAAQLTDRAMGALKSASGENDAALVLEELSRQLLSRKN